MKKRSIRQYFCLLLALCLLSGTLSVPAWAEEPDSGPAPMGSPEAPQAPEAVEPLAAPRAAEEQPAVSYNVTQIDYIQNHNYPILSYLYENESGGLTRVEFVSSSPGTDDIGITIGNTTYLRDFGSVVVEDYSSDLEYLRRRAEIPMELDLFGGFFAGEKFNFLIFGQMNLEEDPHKIAFRVVKYSKNWERLGVADVSGYDVQLPFKGGTARCAEYEDDLYIHTCRQMFKDDEGLNHQSNLNITIRQSDMEVLEYTNDGVTDYGYLSHSLDQFVIVDQDQNIVTLDHGDAFPLRGVLLDVYGIKAGNGKFSYPEGASGNWLPVQRYGGPLGENYTGASTGGLAETSSGYVVAYNYDNQEVPPLGLVGDKWTNVYKPRDVYLAYVPKNSFGFNDAEVRRITNHGLSGPGTLKPVLVPTGLDGGYILWNEEDDFTSKLYYARYFADGTVGEIREAGSAPLSDCQPVYYNGDIVWYTAGKAVLTSGTPKVIHTKTVPTFYRLNEDGLTEVHRFGEWEYDIVNHWRSCTDPGCTKKTGEGPHSLTSSGTEQTCTVCGQTWENTIFYKGNDGKTRGLSWELNGREITLKNDVGSFMLYIPNYDENGRFLSLNGFVYDFNIGATVPDSVTLDPGAAYCRFILLNRYLEPKCESVVIPLN